MKREFDINIYSRDIFLIIQFIIYIIIFIVSYICFLYVTGGKLIAVIFTFSFLLLGYFKFPRLYGKAIIKITSEKRNYKIEYMQPYRFGKMKPILEFHLRDVDSYKYESGYAFDFFKIKFKSGKVLKLNQWSFDKDDDFKKFINSFKSDIKSYNQLKGTTEPIERQKSLLENRTYLIVMAIMFSLIIIGIIVGLILKGTSNKGGLIMVGVILGPMIWSISQIINGLRQK
ncbi:hypothetical protein [Coprobacter tertius]|uniref:YcxB-like protein domain-containing protein n=1 Tax=Coprobacter tertius TaxID=2944915 RepID=A0ABT1MLG0_9BACT|nr:hypothetical protein [Coprobacter tertius]MCP9612909.1 hypothetical protein [Coprobacter tertius]